jgi:hypothetical protein
VPLADQLICPTAANLDGADRRRHLADLAAEARDRSFDRLRRQMFCRNALQQFAFGVLGGGGLAEPDSGGIRLRGGREQAQDLGGAIDPDH